MPFDWMTPKPNPGLAKALAGKREETYLQDLEDRAGLLQRLRYSREQARGRLMANVRWDFEQVKAPARLGGQVDAIIERVYGRGSRKGGADK